MLFERLLYLESNLLFLFSWYAIFLSFSVSGTQQTARMNDFGHGIDPHAVLPRLACQYTHTDLPCQYLRRPQNRSQTETLRQDFSRAKAHNKPGEDITKQTAGKLHVAIKKAHFPSTLQHGPMIYCRILYNTVKETSDQEQNWTLSIWEHIKTFFRVIWPCSWHVLWHCCLFGLSQG